jgi:uncharacterized repeat protein (TIGR01451 family)
MKGVIRVLVGCLVALAAVAVAGAASASSVAAAEAGPTVTVTLDTDRADAGPGETLSFVSTVRNTGRQEVTGLVAHLNVLATDPDVYVDPEDWSPRRTQFLDELAPGDTADVSWNVQAVTSGPLVLFVSVTSLTGDRVVSSEPLRMTVHGQRVVDSTQILPMVMWTPIGVLILLGATLMRRRRHR